MSQLTHYKNTVLTNFKLKPLLIAIPISVLAACANTPESEPSYVLNEPVTYEETSFEDSYVEDTITSGPDLVSTAPTGESNIIESGINASDDTHSLTKIKEEDVPMTVLVIENPEILAKLASNQQLSQESLSQGVMSESTPRPNKRVFHFGFNQTSLSEEDIELVEKHANYLKANHELKVTIHGHTDTQGNANYNLQLSEKRALMLVSQLKKFGINKNRIKIIGWGGNYPLVNSHNFSENRRIEIEYSETHYAANH